MSTVLLVIALVLAIIASLLGFEILSAGGNPHVDGWGFASLAFYLGSLLVPER